MEEVKNKVAILMDFDNWFPTILKDDDLSRLQQLLLDVLNIATANVNDVDYISIGLYGGVVFGKNINSQSIYAFDDDSKTKEYIPV